MNFINIKKLSDLKTILDSNVYIAEHGSLQDQEVIENTWGISIFDIRSAHINQQEILDFITKLMRLRQKQVSFGLIASPITFYVWVDEMASQLRFSFISGYGHDLPFMCKVERISSLQEIINIFFNLTVGEEEHVEEYSEDDFCLKVFSAVLHV